MPDQGNKRSIKEEMDDQSDMKRMKGSESKNEVRILIPSKNAGAIIGKGGDKIKKLREKYLAKVLVPDSESSERVFTIGAELDVACDLLLEVLPAFDENKDKGENFEGEIKLLVHVSQVGAIIGTGGVVIKELREGTGAQVKVYGEVCPNSTDRIVQINGTSDIIRSAIFKIYDILEENPSRGVVKNYDARDRDGGQEYGGFQNSMRGGRDGGGGGVGGRRGGNRNGMPRNSRHGGMGGFGMSDFNDLPYDSRPGRNEYGMGSFDRGDMMDNDFDMSGMSNYGNFSGGNSRRPMKQNKTTQVSIPKEMAGAIIGKSGMRIRNIRNQCGAEITIADPVDGDTERIITIKGNDEQITFAQFLMQKAVKEYM